MQFGRNQPFTFMQKFCHVLASTADDGPGQSVQARIIIKHSEKQRNATLASITTSEIFQLKPLSADASEISPVTERRRTSRSPCIGQASCIGVLLLATASLAGCTESHSSFLDPQGPIAAAQRSHYWFIVAMVMIVVLPVIILTPLLVWRYRYGGKAVYRPKWAFSWTWDIFIWGIPVVIAGVLSYVLWMATTSLDPYKPLASKEQPFRVQVVGLDWKWLFIYPDQHIATVGELVFPANRPVEFDLTSDTVLQTFFIPALGGQMDAMNRMVTKLHLMANSPGSFQGKNMQYNGKGFYTQRFTAKAVNDEAFAAFVQNAHEAERPLGEKQYDILSRQGTLSEAAKALGIESTQPGSVIPFSSVPDGLFDAIVKDAPIDWRALTSASSGKSRSSAAIDIAAVPAVSDENVAALAGAPKTASQDKEKAQ